MLAYRRGHQSPGLVCPRQCVCSEMSVSADQLHCAGLRSLLPFLFDKRHLAPDLQAIKGFVQNAVAVEVDFPAVLRLQEAIILVREEPAYPSVGAEFRGT